MNVEIAAANGRQLAASALGNAKAVAPLLRESGAEIEALRALTPDVLAAMHEQQLFRLTLPRRHGGAELDLPTLAQVAEIVAGADASAAWCLGQALGCAMSAAYMDEGPARQVFDPADAVLAWGAGVVGRAVATDGGYLVSGTWRFASGSHHATGLGGHCRVFEADGSPRKRPDGRPADRTALIPKSDAKMTDDWYVMGLRGTRSESYEIDNLFVPDGLTLDRDTGDQRRVDAVLYRFSTTLAYASMFSSVALGIAQSAFDDLVSLARDKKPRGARTTLKDSPVFQTDLAELQARIGSARAYKHNILTEAWESVAETGTPNLEERARIRLATTYAINEATAAVEKIYRLAGSDAIFDHKPFERRFRDIHAVSQQVQGRPTNYETVGRYLLDLDVDSIFM